MCTTECVTGQVLIGHLALAIVLNALACAVCAIMAVKLAVRLQKTAVRARSAMARSLFSDGEEPTARNTARHACALSPRVQGRQSQRRHQHARAELLESARGSGDARGEEVCMRSSRGTFKQQHDASDGLSDGEHDGDGLRAPSVDPGVMLHRLERMDVEMQALRRMLASQSER